ncbi:N-acetylmuramoyl-L-alanine amidase [Aureibacillus halotolerans]|uniref:N-acetylmuramoyl-L-alanine amidase n=1 Tax=Aureibacillus halotolerans TaxID=1508390 RepID=A0A4R6U3W6_9BACI|nr:N-acetylmuramoyl-L-alanine amidase [Aureibacillus halotolerans]TDQ40376.1 N-acetylmuramoyl-L-alanine amidase [Aureibacillus halotolerans]
MGKSFEWGQQLRLIRLVLIAVILGSSSTNVMAYDSPVESPLPSFQVLIDVGHGGIDGGAVYGELIEKDINLSIAKKLYDQLNSQGISAIVNRNTDYALSEDNRWFPSRSRHKRDLIQRMQLSNEISTDLFISLHVNATKNSTRRGPLVLHQSNELSAYLAQSIQIELNQQQGSARLPKVGKTYYLLNRIKQPAVIVEMGFITNAKDRTMLTDPKEQVKIASAITEGIKHFLLIGE